MGTMMFFTLLLIVLLAGCYITVQNMMGRKPKNNRSIYSSPRGPYETGRRDMLEAIFAILFNNKAKTMMELSETFDNPVKYISEHIFKSPQYIERYRNLNLNAGRTSRTYMTASNGVDFESYIRGGRELIDDVDKYLSLLRNQKEIMEARQYGLEDSDNYHNLTRKELNNLQDREARVKSELEEFDAQLRKLEGK